MPSEPRIPVASPRLDGRESEYVMECLSSGWISSIGRFIGDFEQAFADFCGVRHAIACNNGTTALHLALVGLGIGPGDEVIVPTLTYIASANTVRYCGATPVFVDSDPITFNLDPAQVAAKITPRTKAIMPVHLYGHPADMDPITALAEAHGLMVVEDAAEAIGARYKGRRTGGLGTCAAFSFFGNKIITTGEGGMVTTDDAALADRLRLYRAQGMDPARRYWFPVIGYNYRMTNIAAAIGLAQLERIDDHLAARRWVAAGYDRRLSALPNALSNALVRPSTANWAEHVFWMYTVLLPAGARLSRDEVMTALERDGIETRPVFHPLHVMPPYQDLAGDGFPEAEAIAARGLNLPTHAHLTDEDLDRVVDALARALTYRVRLVLASTFVPFIDGGARFIVEWLETKLLEYGHEVERFYLPFTDGPEDLLTQIAALRLMDLSEAGDRLIAFRPPAYVLRHPHKVLWFIHHIRAYYDLWDSDHGLPHTPANAAVRDALHHVDALALAEARAVFTNSQIVADRLQHFNGIAAAPLYPPVFQPERFRCEGYGEDIVAICRMEPHKRQDLLIAAMRHTTTAVKLRLCGRSAGPEYAAALAASVVQHGLQEKVILEDRWITEAEKADLLATALAVAYVPFDEDSYGYPSLEGAHADKAVITTTDSGGVLELVDDGYNGFVCIPTPQSLAARFDELYRDRSLARRLGAANHARVRALKIDWDHVIAAVTG